MEHKQITMGSLFDGIGGFPLVAVHCGVKPLWASEIEAFSIEVTKTRFPEMLHVGEITKLDGAELPPVDIICGGSPCQDFSVAGARAGLAGARSRLFMEQTRITKEMRNADILRGRTGIFVRPRFLCWENVPGAFSSGNPKGGDFRIVLEEIYRIKFDSLSVPGPDSGTSISQAGRKSITNKENMSQLRSSSFSATTCVISDHMSAILSQHEQTPPENFLSLPFFSC